MSTPSVAAPSPAPSVSPVSPPPAASPAPVTELPLGYISYQEGGRTYYRSITLLMLDASGAEQEIPSEMVAHMRSEAGRVADLARGHFQGVIDKQGSNAHDPNLLGVKDEGFVYRSGSVEALNRTPQGDDKSAQNKWDEFKACVFGLSPAEAPTTPRRSPAPSPPLPPPPLPLPPAPQSGSPSPVAEHLPPPPSVLGDEAPSSLPAHPVASRQPSIESEASISPPPPPPSSVWSTLRAHSAFTPVPSRHPVAAFPASTRPSTPSGDHIVVRLGPQILVDAMAQERLRREELALRASSGIAYTAAHARPSPRTDSAHTDASVPGSMTVGGGTSRATRRRRAPTHVVIPSGASIAVRLGTPEPSRMEEVD